MKSNLYLYNTLSRIKEYFLPINPPNVTIYLCGPTVYGDSHLGHARSAITFDTIVRYLKHLKFNVKYIRNITDVGHLERDSDDGEDKIIKRAKLENLDVMELAHHYTTTYRRDLLLLNTITPNIEPAATGHIIEQIEMIKSIVKNGYAYEINGSVYFDVRKYSKKYNYGYLSGRKTDDLLANTRNLDTQNEKKSSLDFALWKNAGPNHILRWPSPWGRGYPGWHIECSAMSTKYLGEKFDIHGGGLELSFPHHECEIAQCTAATGSNPVKYWVHHNMVNIDGQKMSKSLNNFITLRELFNGEHEYLDKAYSPMVLRFFILQAHYRSVLNFSIEGLKSAEKGYIKMMNSLLDIKRIQFSDDGEIDENLLNKLEKNISLCYKYMDDDFNTARVIAALFDISKYINKISNDEIKISALSEKGFLKVKKFVHKFIIDILGLVEEKNSSVDQLIGLIIKTYQIAKKSKNYELVDSIRATLKQENLNIADRKNGDVAWYHC